MRFLHVIKISSRAMHGVASGFILGGPRLVRPTCNLHAASFRSSGVKVRIKLRRIAHLGNLVVMIPRLSLHAPESKPTHQTAHAIQHSSGILLLQQQ